MIIDATKRQTSSIKSRFSKGPMIKASQLQAINFLIKQARHIMVITACEAFQHAWSPGAARVHLEQKKRSEALVESSTPMHEVTDIERVCCHTVARTIEEPMIRWVESSHYQGSMLVSLSHVMFSVRFGIASVSS